MDFRIISTNTKIRRRGFTLVELLISVSVAVLCFASAAAVFAYTTRGLQSLFNYADLHADDRIAVDILTSDIRQSIKVSSFTTNSLTLMDFDGGTLTYTYDATAKTFVRSKGGQSKVLLTDCERLSFKLGERNPVGGSYDVYPTANAATAKVIDVSWLCSRKIKGEAVNSATVQTARIVIRRNGV